MYSDEVLRKDGDSVWGRITYLASSLLGRPCTGQERAQFYEMLLLSSIRHQKSDAEVICSEFTAFSTLFESIPAFFHSDVAREASGSWIFFCICFYAASAGILA